MKRKEKKNNNLVEIATFVQFGYNVTFIQLQNYRHNDCIRYKNSGDKACNDKHKYKSQIILQKIA